MNTAPDGYIFWRMTPRTLRQLADWLHRERNKHARGSVLGRQLGDASILLHTIASDLAEISRRHTSAPRPPQTKVSDRARRRRKRSL